MKTSTTAERLKEAMAQRGLRQADLVELTGIGKSSISTYLSGAYEPKQRNLHKLAQALDVEEAWLMGLDNEEDITSTSTDSQSIETLSPVKEALLTSFDKLNTAGQDKAVEYVNDLADNPKYQKNNIKIMPLPKTDNSNRVELKIDGDAPYIPEVAAAHHPTGDLSEADKKDIAFLNELVGKLKKDKGNS